MLIANVVIFVRWTHRTNWRLTSPARIIRLLTNYVLVWIRDYNQKRIPSFNEESEISPFGFTQLGHSVSILPTSSAFSSKRRGIAVKQGRSESQSQANPSIEIPTADSLDAKEKAKLTTKRQEPWFYAFYAIFCYYKTSCCTRWDNWGKPFLQKEEKDQCRLFTFHTCLEAKMLSC